MGRILTVAAALIFVTAGTAFAQSGEGGYLGLNPGKGGGASAAHIPPLHGSGQGGYLGLNPGADLTSTNTTPTRGSGQGGYLGANPAGKWDQRAARIPANPS